MKQNDYNEQSSFASRRPAQQNQYQPNFVNMPQPTMQGGNFAPRPMPANQPSQMFGNNGPIYKSAQQMPGYDDFYNSYQKNLQQFQAMNEKYKKGVDESEADENLEKMNDLLSKINGDDTSVDAGAGNIAQVAAAMSFVSKSLEEPETWLPPARAAYADKIREHGVKLANALNKFKDTITKLKVT